MDGPLVVARFLHFAATMGLFGATFFVAAVSPSPLADELGAPLRRLAPALALVALASGVAWFASVTFAMSGGLDAASWRDVATGAEFGRVWVGRSAVLALTLAATLAPGRRWRLCALLSGVSLASLALVGHAAMQEGALGAAHRANQALHLLTTGGWLGGLAPFLICLDLFRRAPRRPEALAAMMRFSRVGHLSVAIVFATGAVNVALTVGAWPWPPRTPYFAGLDAKMLVYFAMVAIALVNRYGFAPRAGRSPRAARALALGALAEIGLGLVAVALVSAFATLDPHPPR